jgi:hypothetical protein
MDEQRFDAALRALQAGTTRRRGLAGMLGALLGGTGLEAAAKGTRNGNGKPGAEGPCGDGSAKANRCQKNGDCCTRYCADGACRCKPNWMVCTKADQCCSGRCVGGKCDGGAKPAGASCTEDFNCQDGLACVRGACVKSSKAKCTRQNCPGCCEGTTCRPGADRTACGTGGGACVRCGASQTCTAGVCGGGGGSCSAATCPDGCCQNGQCRPSANASCGTGGAACVDCTAGGEVCNAGACGVQCTVCGSGCAYTKIADAIAGTADGGTILVGPGTWNEGKLLLAKSLTIAGCDPDNPPVIDSGTDSSGVFTTSLNGETLTFTLSDVELKAPSGEGMTFYLGTTATIERVKVSGSTRGIRVKGANATIKDGVIENNTSSRNGGGLLIEESTVVIEDTIIRNNSSTRTGNGSYGGGGLFSEASTVTLKGTTSVTGNTAAARGGGVYLIDGSFTMESTASITGNTAACYGGLYSDNASGTYTTVTGVSSSTVNANTATGVCGCNNYSTDGSCAS